MSPPEPTSHEPPAAETVERVIKLIREGRPLTAMQLLPDFEKVAAQWNNATALTTAARLAERLGGSDASRWHRLNYRRHPDDDVCFFHRIWELDETLGVPRTLRILETRLKKPEMDPKRRADLLLAGTKMLGRVRDFETANRWMDEALELRPLHPWTLSCKAALLRRQDRPAEALEICREVMVLNPASEAGMASTASILMEMNRCDEAVQILLDGCERTECADPRWQLYIFHSERENADTALHWLQEYERHLPLLPAEGKKRLRGAHATLHLLRGDMEAAREAAAACGNRYHERMVENMSASGAAEARRVRIPVGFVRQHHMTCGPATLSALASYWGASAPHLEIAERICYDGTSNHSERTWAQEQGLDGREFTVTPELTRQLVARGVPFTLVTTWTTSAHLQAVIGTDDRAGLLIIRDPSSPHYSEALLDGFLKDYAAHGPRGMLVLPESERTRVEGLVLPEAEWYDLVHAMEGALQKHDRSLAQQFFDKLNAAAPGHRLTWMAQSALSSYDDDPVKSHEAQNALARLFPDSATMAWRAFRANFPRRTRTESLTELEGRVREPVCDTVFKSELARMLSDDARTVPRAKRLLHRLIRHDPGDAQSLNLMGNCCWTERTFDDALEYYRLASCTADKNEGRAATFFDACRRLNRAETGLTFLRRRWESFGHLSAEPAITLANALEELLRVQEALDVICAAQQKRPQDGILLLRESSLHRKQGRFDNAAAQLEKAKNLVPDQDWRRQAAILAHVRGNAPEAISHWQAVLATEPLAMDAHEEVARLAADTAGFDAALALLKDATERWPWHMGLARLRVSWLRRQNQPEAETELRRILEHNSADAWALRELSLELAHRRRHEEAVTAATDSLKIQPGAAGHYILGSALQAMERNPEAHAAYRKALELSIDCGAMQEFIETAGTAAEKRKCIDFLRDELAKQTTDGDGVSNFHSAAVPHLSTEEMTSVLREGKLARPDLVETWTALAHQLLNLQDTGALELTREMTERFPASPGCWRLYSLACGQQDKALERLSALHHAVSINPHWSLAARDLAELHERAGRIDKALETMERMVAAQPLDPLNHGLMAEILERHGRNEDAISSLLRSVELEPGYAHNWETLSNLCLKTGQPERAVAAAQRLTAQRPDEPRSFTVLGEVLFHIERHAEALATIDSALERWPKNLRLHEIRVYFLHATDRNSEALAACQPAAFGDAVPRELQTRKARLLMDAADYAEAEKILETLIVTEPDYAWPRSLLYDLCRMRKDNDRCLSLTRDLVRLEPFNAVYAGMFAESLTNAGKTGEALSAVRRALEIDPAYGYASNRLFNSLLEAGDLVGATQLAALMERFQKGPRSQLAQARLAIAENRMDDAERYAEALTGTDEEGAEWALDALRSFWPDVLGSHIDRLGRMVSRMVREGRAKNPGVCEIWIKLRRPTEVVRDIGEALTLPVSELLRNAIVQRLLYQASDAGAHESALKAVRKHGAVLRSSTPLWGAVTYVMVRAEKHRKLLRWAADWRTREGREPWMISNVGYALLIEKGPLAAGEAWTQVLEHGASGVWDQAAAGMAFVNAVQSRPDEARRLINNLRGQQINATDKFSVALAEAALGAAKAGQGRNRQNRERALGFFREADTAWPGGLKTKYGKHYLRELRSFLSGNRLDPTFGKPPDSRRYFDQGVPRWVTIPFVIAAIAGMRICHSSSREKRYQIPNLPTTPEWKPVPVPVPNKTWKPGASPNN